MPVENCLPSYGQLYVIDSTVANRIRCEHESNSSLNPETIQILSNILANNPYAISYHNAGNVLRQEMLTNQPRTIDLRFVDSICLDQRRYNKPTANEIAGVFFSETGEPPHNRYVVAHGKQGGPKLLSTYSPHCDPMMYPLIFPSGEPGWDKELKHNGNRRQVS